MLIPGIIPKEEPVLRVGIILPGDKKKSVSLKINNQKTCIFYIDGKETPLPLGGELKIIASGDGLETSVFENSLEIQNIKLVQQSPDDFIIVEEVVAGRGFHWLKKISVKLPHTVEIVLKDNFLMLLNELPLETYLACVATSEMSAECPVSYIEAQTIVARSWMLANVEQKHVHLGFDVCNDDCCQRYQGVNKLTQKSREGAFKSSGLVLMYQNKICDARYSKSCGGIMEKFENLWENKPLPYMQNIPDADVPFEVDLSREEEMGKWVEDTPKTFCSPYYIPEDQLIKYLGNVDESGHYFRWTIKVSQEELITNLNEKLGLNAGYVISLIPLKRGGSGRLLKLGIKYKNKKNEFLSAVIEKDYEVRRVLHKDFLFSSAIIIEEIKNKQSLVPEAFVFKGAGWGHGAGMCQIGALGMALNGIGVKEIVSHYYPGSELIKIY